jgi:hypothetical protein
VKAVKIKLQETPILNSFNTCRIRDSGNGGYEESYLLGYNTAYPVEIQPLLINDVKNVKGKIHIYCKGEVVPVLN